jgi:hypothetical protein
VKSGVSSICESCGRFRGSAVDYRKEAGPRLASVARAIEELLRFTESDGPDRYDQSGCKMRIWITGRSVAGIGQHYCQCAGKFVSHGEDRTLGGFGVETGADAPPRTRFEIHRDDLLDILFTGIDGSVELLIGRSIKQLEDDESEGVTVTLEDGARRAYALVFGCDGNRSNTRKLVFGDEKNFTYFMGGYVYLKVVPVTGIYRPTYRRCSACQVGRRC